MDDCLGFPERLMIGDSTTYERPRRIVVVDDDGLIDFSFTESSMHGIAPVVRKATLVHVSPDIIRFVVCAV